MKPATLVTVCLLALIAAAHLLRVVLGISLVVADIVIPMWPSVVAVLVTGALAVLLWREQRQAPLQS